MDRESEFSKAAGHRILKNQTDKRVSGDAALQLVEELTEIGGEIAEQAQSYAEHAGRKTVQLQDVRQAIRDYREDR